MSELMRDMGGGAGVVNEKHVHILGQKHTSLECKLSLFLASPNVSYPNVVPPECQMPRHFTS